MMGIGLPEIGIVLVVAVLIFGPKKLPSLGRGLGSGMREFKEGITGKDDDDAPAHLAAPPVQTGVPTEPAAGEPSPIFTEPASAPVVDPDAPAPPRTTE
jgi:sec-independent protein translocase protein TatA